MNPADYIEAARVPRSLQPQQFGLWNIQRLVAGGQQVETTMAAMERHMVGFDDYTLLRRVTEATMPTLGEIVMEDSARELRKHLPIWIAASGRVLITGLGLGCVVRGLLAKPDVDHIDVIEIDRDIIRVCGAEFAGNPRVSIYHDDALKFDAFVQYDFAWHDIWCPGNDGLDILHINLMHRFLKACGPQGAWAFPKIFKRRVRQKSGFELLG